MDRGSSLIFILLFIFSHPSFADEGIPANWRTCTLDADCTAVAESCLYWDAINKKHIKEFARSLSSCSPSVDPGFEPLTVCAKMKCTVTDKTTDVSWEDWLNEMNKMHKMKVKKD